MELLCSRDLAPRRRMIMLLRHVDAGFIATLKEF
jgi:hypothetical protein